MRFLLFNVVVAGALAYLLYGGGGAPEVGQVVQRTLDAAGAMAGAGKDMVARRVGLGEAEGPQSPGTAAAPPPVSRERAPLFDEALLGDGPVAVAPPPLPALSPRQDADQPPVPALSELPGTFPAVGPAVGPAEDPAVARRRAEVLGEIAEAQPPGAADEATFMTPSDRQRELYRLAQEMELIFVDKVAK